MNSWKPHRLLICTSVLLAGLSPLTAFAVSDPEELMRQAQIVERLNSTVDMSRTFTDHLGKQVSLRDLLIPGRPALAVPVYYTCPRVCAHTLQGLTNGLNELSLKLGKDYSVITFSFDPSENFELAAERAFHYYGQLKEPKGGEAGWHFLTGNEENTRQLAAELGFGFARDGRDFSHAALAVVLMPDGRIARYFYGVDFPPQDLRFALIEASEGRIGTAVDRILLFCYRFDHLTGRYSLAIWSIVRIVSFAVVILLAGALLLLRRREVRAMSNA